MVKEKYIIAKSAYEVLELDRLEYLQNLAKVAPKQDFTRDSLSGSFYFKRGTAYLMGGKGNRITHLYKCPNNAGGCQFMPGIRASDFAKAMMYLAQNNVSFIGIARTGQFHTSHLDSIGDGLGWLADKSKGFKLLSFGRNGMKFQEVTTTRWGDESFKNATIRIGK